MNVATWCVPDSATAGIGNFIREAATSTAEFAICALHFVEQAAEHPDCHPWFLGSDALLEIRELAAGCDVIVDQ